MIVIGASLGGMKVLRTILTSLPADFPRPIAIVLHRHREGADLLVNLLQQASLLPISEALDKEPLVPGRVYLAPPDYHLLVEPAHLCLSTDDPIQYARPSVDVLFESAADAFGSKVMALVLTGANHDGARGAARIMEKGGRVLVQHPATAESPVMPQAAIDSTGTRDLLRPEELGPFLLTLVLPSTSKTS